MSRVHDRQKQAHLARGKDRQEPVGPSILPSPFASDRIEPPLLDRLAVAGPPPHRGEALRLGVAVRSDPALVTRPDPDHPCPEEAAAQLFPLDQAETLIGRHGPAKDGPEIQIADPGISRRHVMLLRDGDGGVTVVDLNSTNGTKLNDVALEPGIERPVRPGDELLIGKWTRLTIQAL